jgi:hypothetical protein
MHEDLSSHSLFRSSASIAHARLLDALTELAQMERATQQTKAWQALETRLLAHMRAEEDLMLPDFGLMHSDDAAHVRGAHERIRQCIVQVQDTASTRGLDPRALDELGTLLRTCAAFEERLLYPWAERQLRPSKRGEFLLREREQVLNTEIPHWHA